ncbi:MAG: ABC transporter permease [Candidatus Thermoplasmatota archaeon]|nr:ABC transporter permease [Candidatus Thermoplasmatota archaeon]
MNLRFSLAFAWYYGFRTIKRGPSYVIASLSSPLTLLFLIYIISHGELIRYAVVGGFLGLVASVSFASVADAAFLRIQLRIQDLFVATSISPTDYILGLTLSYLIFSMPGIILYAIIGSLIHIFTLESITALILLLLVLTISTAGLSMTIGGAVNHIRNVWGISAIMSVVLTVLPPTFYPYSDLPKYIIYILAISPTTPAAVLAQGFFGFEPIMYVMIPIMVVETIVFFALARFFTRWREN